MATSTSYDLYPVQKFTNFDAWYQALPTTFIQKGLIKFGTNDKGQTVFQYGNGADHIYSPAYGNYPAITDKQWLEKYEGFKISDDGRSLVSTLPPGQWNMMGIGSDSKYVINGSGADETVTSYGASPSKTTGTFTSPIMGAGNVPAADQFNYLYQFTKFAQGVQQNVKSYTVTDSGVLGDIANLVNSLGPVAPIALSFVMPGVGTAIGAALGVSGAAGAAIGSSLLATALNGGDLSAGLKAGLASYTGAQLGGIAGDIAKGGDLGTFLQNNPTVLSGVVNNVSQAAIKGQDIETALAGSLLYAGVNAATSKIDGFKDLPDPVKNSITSGITQSLQGKDVTASGILQNAALNGIVSYGLNQIPEYENLDKKYQTLAATTLSSALQGKDLTQNAINWALNQANSAVNTALSDDKNKQAVDAGFPDYKTYQEYGGDKDLFFAKQAGFPDVETFRKFGGDFNAYKQSQSTSSEVKSATQQLVDALTNPQVTSDSGTQVAGPGGVTGGETGATDSLGMTNDQKSGIASYLSNSAGGNSGITKEADGTYTVSDPSNSRTLKFSSDGTYLGQTVLISESEATKPLANDFMTALAAYFPPAEKGEGVGADNQYTYSQGAGGEGAGAAGTGTGSGTGEGAGGSGAESGAVSTADTSTGGSQGDETGTQTGATGTETTGGTQTIGGDATGGTGGAGGAEADPEAVARSLGFPDAATASLYDGDFAQYQADQVAERNHQDIMNTFHAVLGRDPTPEEYARFSGQNAIDVQREITPSENTGASGSSGEGGADQSGYSGVDEVSGYSGYSGFDGESGISGYSGVAGESGISGMSGMSGFSGYSGLSGESGLSGHSGMSGFSGESGMSGFSGTSGMSGFSGTSGMSGFSGASGISGTSGVSGISGYSGLAGRAGADATAASFGSQFGSTGAGAVSGPATTELKHQFLTSKETPYKFVSPLAAVLALSRSGGSEDNQAYQGENTMQTPHYSYGNVSSIDEILGMPDYFSALGGGSGSELPQEEQAATGGLMASPLMAATGGMAGTRYGQYAGGGLPGNVVHHSGKARVDFRRGDAVTGAGDGQSDDIPAMLADGEFVFPADVVAAIGNGSTKAGSDKLYDMMHGIRAHVRSAKPKDLPPEIKSPLDFLGKKRRKA